MQPIFTKVKDTNKRAKNQRKTCFSLFFRARDRNATLRTFRSENLLAKRKDSVFY